jgi:hypothetical protein
MIVGEPKVRPGQNSPLFSSAASSALRALKQCEPYTTLPPEMYEGGWDYMVVRFDPSRMFR